MLRSQVPLVLRRTPDAVYLVGAAAGPLGGDLLSLRITVGPGAFLRVRTAAAAIALPGIDGAESVFSVTADVASRGCLEYVPEPLVAAAGARLATDFRFTLAEDASLLLREEILLGRHGETGGTARTSLRVDRAGRPLLRQALEVGGDDQASLGPAVLSGHRAIGTLLRTGPGAGPAADTSPASRTGSAPGVAVMPLAGDAGVLVTALADDAVTLRRRLSR